MPNCGFEVDADGNRLPDDWGAKPDAAEPDAVGLDDAETHGGRWSVRIRHAKASSYTKFRTRVATRPHSDYAVSFWVEVDVKAPLVAATGRPRGMVLSVFGQDDALASSESIASTDGNWRQVTFSLGSSAGSGRFR